MGYESLRESDLAVKDELSTQASRYTDMCHAYCLPHHWEEVGITFLILKTQIKYLSLICITDTPVNAKDTVTV